MSLLEYLAFGEGGKEFEDVLRALEDHHFENLPPAVGLDGKCVTFIKFSLKVFVESLLINKPAAPTTNSLPSFSMSEIQKKNHRRQVQQNNREARAVHAAVLQRLVGDRCSRQRMSLICNHLPPVSRAPV